MLRRLILTFFVSFAGGQATFPSRFPQYCAKTALYILDSTGATSLASALVDQSAVGAFRTAATTVNGVTLTSGALSFPRNSGAFVNLALSDGRAVGQFTVNPLNPFTFGAWVQPLACSGLAGYNAHILNLGQGATDLPYFFVGIDSLCRLVVGWGNGYGATGSINKVETIATGPVLSTAYWNFVSVTLLKGIVTMSVLIQNSGSTSAVPFPLNPFVSPSFTTTNFTITAAGFAYTSANIATTATMPSFAASQNYIGRSQYTGIQVNGYESFQGYISNIQVYGLPFAASSVQTWMYNTAASAGSQSDLQCGVVRGAMSSISLSNNGGGASLFDFQVYDYPLLFSTGVDILKNVAAATLN